MCDKKTDTFWEYFEYALFNHRDMDPTKFLIKSESMWVTQREQDGMCNGWNVESESPERQIRTYRVNTYCTLRISEPDCSDQSFDSVPLFAQININGEMCHEYEDHEDGTILHHTVPKVSDQVRYVNVQDLRERVNEIFWQEYDRDEI